MSDAASAPVEITTSISEKNTVTEPSNTAPAKEKIKVDGVEEEWTAEELKKWGQIGRSKEKRFEESAKARKEAETFKERLKNDWAGVLKELGVDSRAEAEKFLLAQLEEEQLSPEAKEQRDLKKRLKEYEDKELSAKEQREKEKEHAETEKWAVQLDNDISAALQTSAIPKSPGSVRRVAKVLYDALEAGEDMSAEEAVAYVEDEYRSDIKELFALIGDPSKLLPEDISKKLMGDHLAKVKGAPQSHTQATKSEPKADKQPKTLSSSDFGKLIRG